jgi:hypothetical protein
MACTVFGWLQRTIGVDITGESEFLTNLAVAAMEENDPAQPPTTSTTTITTTTSSSSSSVAAALPRVPVPPALLKRSSPQRVLIADPTITPPRAAARHSRVEVFSPRRRPPLLEPPDTKNQLLRVEPPALYFPPPLDRFINTTLTLSNASPHFVMFKLKATTPTRYAVKIRQGVLGPQERMDIRITLCPVAPDVRKIRDKFLVQCRALVAHEVAAYQSSGDLQALWRNEKGADVIRTKIPCKFTTRLPPDFYIEAAGDDSDDGDDGLAGVVCEAADEDPEAGDVDPAPPLGLLQKRRHTYCCPVRD